MDPVKKNLFDLSGCTSFREEIFTGLLFAGTARVERIISSGQVTPEGQWYDQKQDEWVLLLSGHARLRFGTGQMMDMAAGDYVFLPAGLKHSVIYTSRIPKCIWLAIHGDIEIK